MTAVTVLETDGVLAARLPGAEYLALGMVVPTGFAVDPADAPGTAHLAEHLAVRRATAAVAEPPAITAFTRCHATVFTAEALPEQATDALRAFAALTVPVPVGARDDEALEQERWAVRHELEVTAAQPAWRIGAAVAAALAPETGLAAEHDATTDTIGAVTRDHVDGMIAADYRPGRSTLAVVGDLPPRELLERAAEAGLCAPPDPGPAPEPSVRCHEHRDTGLPSAYGVSFLLAGPARAAVAPWGPAVLDALVSPSGPVAAAVRELSGTAPLAHSVLRCRYGWLASVAWTGTAVPALLADAGGRVRDAAVDRVVTAAARAHDRAHGSPRVPTQVRDALAAQVEGSGLGPVAAGVPFDEERAAALARGLLDGTRVWRLRDGAAETIGG